MKKILAAHARYICRQTLVLSIILFFTAYSYAGLIINPARSEIVIEKESSFEGVYSVENSLDKTVEVTVTAKNWNNSQENKGVDISDWLTVDNYSFKLEPRSKRDVNYTVRSKNFQGSLSGMISFTIRSPDYGGINLMTSVPVYMTINGTQNISFAIEKLVISNKRIRLNNDENKEISVEYSVKNDGNVYIRPAGNATVLKNKKVVKKYTIQEQSPVYPGLERGFYEHVQSLPQGKYVLNISLSALNKTVEKSIQFRVNKYGDVSY
ncbi:MAG: hypothetical protein FWH43_06280 [Endomicrobia bacterium]|nr:hypothetical protein [Endomicrobiia bacterium]